MKTVTEKLSTLFFSFLFHSFPYPSQTTGSQVYEMWRRKVGVYSVLGGEWAWSGVSTQAVEGVTEVRTQAGGEGWYFMGLWPEVSDLEQNKDSNCIGGWPNRKYGVTTQARCGGQWHTGLQQVVLAFTLGKWGGHCEELDQKRKRDASVWKRGDRNFEIGHKRGSSNK